jgi:hypothetical protein
MLEELCRAVLGKRVLSLVYKLEQRSVEPHSCYTNPKGNFILFAFQTSGEKPGWRTFDIDKISSLMATGQTFLRPREDYKRHDPYKPGYTVHCEI